MSLSVILPWTDQDIELYHGTLDTHVPSILRRVNLARCKPLRDFGRGFYTTTNRKKAEAWANDVALTGGGNPAVIEFVVSRNALAILDCLCFVRGDSGAVDYWSFVQYCRTTIRDHNRRHQAWYDIVVGPVAGSWKRQTIIRDADQISFHTDTATGALDKSRKNRVL